jgi:hypothetical protein
MEHNTDQQETYKTALEQCEIILEGVGLIFIIVTQIPNSKMCYIKGNVERHNAAQMLREAAKTIK